MSSGSRYYLNALFDLQLGNYPTAPVNRSAAEMSVLFLPLLTPGDSIILDVDFRDDFIGYLKRSGVIFPGFSKDFTDRSPVDRTDIVWGWNAHAAEKLQRVIGPDWVQKLAVVADVNNRLFCNECSERFGTGVPGTVFYHMSSDFGKVVEHRETMYPLVVKPAFGGSGFGIKVIDSKETAETLIPVVDEYCRHGGCVVEPWCERVADVSTCINIREDGTFEEPMFHSQWVNKHGTFYGIMIDNEDPAVTRWQSPLLQMTLQYAGAAAEKGYRGYLGIDSFVYKGYNGEEKLAAGIEINGRFTMGILAQILRKKLSPKNKLLFRFIGKKRCNLSDACEKIEAQLGSYAYTQATGEGVLLLTPPFTCWNGVWAKPRRYAFALFADSRQKLEELDNAVINCLNSPNR